MNTNDDRNDSASELDVHAMLTALVLGELEPDVAARWEARCANDPDLLAQKERIEATIGMLKTALPGGAALSADTLAALEQAAAAGPARPARSFPWRFAIAAGTVIGVGFGFAHFADDDVTTPEPSHALTAQATDERAADAAQKLDDFAKDVARRESDSTIQPAAEARDQQVTPDPIETNTALGFVDGAEKPKNEPASAVMTVTTLPDPAAVPVVPRVPSPLETAPALVAGTPAPAPVASTPAAQAGSGAVSAAPLGPGGGLGRGKFGAPAKSKAGEARSGPATVGGGRGPLKKYRGPGDSVPPAEGPGPKDESASSEERKRLGENGYTAGATGADSGFVGGTSIGVGSGDKSLEQKINEKLRTKEQSKALLDSAAADGATVSADLIEELVDDDRKDGFGNLPAAERARIVVESCRPRPNELPRDMFFRWYGDHAFQRTALDRLSTFSIDVDTASYPLARSYLDNGQIPPKDAVRTEEFVNYFKPDLGAPTDGSPFAVWLEAAPSPFGGTDRARWLLRVGVRAKDIAKTERQPLRLVFVVDNSGSMAQGNRLELVKYGLRLLAGQLDPRDQIAIVRFATDASVLLQWTNASDRASIEAAIHGMTPNGSTNAEAGLKLGYDLAVAGLEPEAVNRVVILSDGVANTGQTDQDRICADVKDKRQRGIYLNAIGVGMGNHNDTFLERLADQGDGVCSYIDDEAEAKRSLVDRFIAQTMTIARDVKIQVDFDPNQVSSWRQLGYENRAIADADFRNDAVDAGEVGAGHQVVALYEIEPSQVRACAKCSGRGFIEFYNTTPSKSAESESVACDKCNHTGWTLVQTDASLATSFATIRLRYKQPYVAGANAQNETAQEIAATIPSNAVRAKFEDTSVGFQQSALVAQFAEFLRRSIHARGDSLDDLLAKCVALAKTANDAEFAEFTQLVDRSRALILQQLPRTDELTQAVDALRRNHLLQCELNSLAQNQATDVLKQLEEQNRKLEDEIRRLIEQRMK